MADHGLKGALELTGPEACLAYYRDWAANYDSGFADGMEYLLPAHVAAAFLGSGGAGPVLDVGAGTGLLAERLRGMGFNAPIDGVDFSPEMLARAAEKQVYRALVQADITRPLALPRQYRGIVSSGTFTAGHVGPEALPNLLGVALPGAQVALSVNRRVWASAGFDRVLDGLSQTGLSQTGLLQTGRIADLHLIEVEVYGAAAAAVDADHAADRALIALFRAV
ncbi:MAG: class I SAM-dependent methyltransferase [Tabrizicola sp.]|uniref:class I SAM-dependent DNA methyltransferase n=1 Tax=Tabrizicola sp. TaxID=2005166 RepID=UPI00273273FE|nr:class I SAM-dependent methyltransferase [Tabrizicola sp.]MDP3262571.1 class I SAM-dependent methyltransferase [Tabrizicola sp.]MDP3648409.1 class I SAM-dependent methyltransferase [Paracoccaceae bacterium]